MTGRVRMRVARRHTHLHARTLCASEQRSAKQSPSQCNASAWRHAGCHGKSDSEVFHLQRGQRLLRGVILPPLRIIENEYPQPTAWSLTVAGTISEIRGVNGVILGIGL